MIDISLYEKMMKLEQRRASKLVNADKKKLTGMAREVYLQGFAGLSNCEDVAARGNEGRGFKVPVYVSKEYAKTDKKNNKRKKKGKKSGD